MTNKTTHDPCECEGCFQFREVFNRYCQYHNAVSLAIFLLKCDYNDETKARLKKYLERIREDGIDPSPDILDNVGPGDRL